MWPRADASSTRMAASWSVTESGPTLVTRSRLGGMLGSRTSWATPQPPLAGTASPARLSWSCRSCNSRALPGGWLTLAPSSFHDYDQHAAGRFSEETIMGLLANIVDMAILVNRTTGAGEYERTLSVRYDGEE